MTKHKTVHTRGQTSEGSNRQTVKDPHILRGVIDQTNTPWICYGTPDRYVWFSVHNLIGTPTKVFERLASVGAYALANASREAIKREVEQFRAFEHGFVADFPGWTSNAYVTGDGRVIAPPGHPEVIVGFETDPKFIPVGTLKAANEALGPLMTGQPLLLFAYAAAFLAPLRRFMPAEYVDPLVEFVGDPMTGKSSLGILATSAWAGRVNSNVGGGDAWSTLASIDELKPRRRDGLLYLDDASNIRESLANIPTFLRNAVFTLTNVASRRVHGAPVVLPDAHIVTISTSNAMLKSLMQEAGPLEEATLSRLTTIKVPPADQLGVLHHLPQGYGDSEEVIKLLRRLLDENYGVAGPEFIRRLHRYKESSIRKFIARRLASYERKAEFLQGSQRARYAFASIAAAGVLARKLCVIPRPWGSLIKAVLSVHSTNFVPEGFLAKPIDRVRGYVDRKRDALLSIEAAKQVTRIDFETSAGCLIERDGVRNLLVSPKAFRRAFPNAVPLLKSLNVAHHLRPEGGKNPKLVNKPPNELKHLGRVYWITGI